MLSFQCFTSWLEKSLNVALLWTGTSRLQHTTGYNLHEKKKPKPLWSEVKWSEVAQSCPTLCNPVDCRVLIIFRRIKVSREFENTALMQEFPTLLPSRRHGNWSYYKAQRGGQLVYSYRPSHWVSGSLSAGRSVSWSSRNWLQAAEPVWLVNEKLYMRPHFHQLPTLPPTVASLLREQHTHSWALHTGLLDRRSQN